MKQPIIHRDVKLDNVLISNDDHAKLGDFGFSGIASLFRGKTVGTPGYMAPEIVASGFYSISSDNYAYALTVWELLCCQLIRLQQHERLISEELMQSILARIPKYVPLSIASIMISCLNNDPLRRAATAFMVTTAFKMHERELLQSDKRFNTVLLDPQHMVKLKQLFQQYHLTEFNESFFDGFSDRSVLYGLLKTGNALFFKELMALAGETADYSKRNEYAVEYQGTCLRCFGVTTEELSACLNKILKHVESVTIESLFDSAKQISIVCENITVRLLEQPEPWLVQALALDANSVPQKITDITTAIEANTGLLKTSIPVFSSRNSALIKNFIAQLHHLISEASYLDKWPLLKLEFIYYLQQFINALKANESVRTLEFINELVQQHLMSSESSIAVIYPKADL